MANYIIEVVAHVPVPRRFTYRQEGSNVAVATSRALKQLRKDLPRKRIEVLNIKVVQIRNNALQSTHE